MSEAIAKQWLHDAATSANNKDHAAHMALIPKNVSRQGIPGCEDIRYEDWAAQTKHEFENNILKIVCYDGLKLITSTPTHIMFKTFETVEANAGGQARVIAHLTSNNIRQLLTIHLLLF